MTTTIHPATQSASDVSAHSAREIRDQVVLITGGARGLGHALTEAFLGEGARVIVNYRSSRDSAEALVQRFPDRAIALAGDVRDRDAMSAVVDTASTVFGAPVTTVVNNALVDFSFNGDARRKAKEISFADFAGQFQGAVEGALNTIQAALPGFEEIGFGRVINVGTNLFQNPVVPYHDYTAAKAALLSLTRTFAADLGPKGVTVNMISGGLLRTTDASAATPAEVFDVIAANTPLRSVTSPAEFAAAALFFASPWSRAVTGQNLVVDGGLVMN